MGGHRASFIGLLWVVAAACDGGPTDEPSIDPGSSGGGTSSTTGAGGHTSGGEVPRDPTADASGFETTTTSGVADSSSSGSTGEVAPPTCAPGSLAPGRYDSISLQHQGTTRTYDLFVPSTIDVDAPVPLVVNFHGLLGSPSQQAQLSRYDSAAEQAGVIVAYPAGLFSSWNAGACCGQAQTDGVDDLDFARVLVQHIGLGSCIDRQRVFALGMSNGGHMAHRLACEAADLFAGVASVTGVLTQLDCTPSRPISVQQFHGTADAIVQYGGAGPGYPAVEPMMAAWAQRNGCAPVPEVSHEQGDSLCETWIGCDDDVEVTLCTIDGGGHCWFGNPSCLLGASTTDVDANAVFQRLLETQQLPDR